MVKLLFGSEFPTDILSSSIFLVPPILVDEQIGGFMDPGQEIDGATVVEKAATAALREATEETGINKRLLEGAQVIPLDHRSYDRPFDIRVAWGDMPGTDIKKGDFFAVSTQGFCVKTTQDLSQVSLKAGDDAKQVLVASFDSR